MEERSRAFELRGLIERGEVPGPRVKGCVIRKYRMNRGRGC